jgi:Skp family chaperone for outer membrane proteins
MNKLLFGTALAVLAAAMPAASSAQRIGPAVVAVVDTDRISRECTACRGAQTQLQQQIQQFEQRRVALTTPLQTEGQAIQTAVRALNGRQPDAALQARIAAFQNSQNTAEQELAGRQRTLQSTQAHVNQQIGLRRSPIINTVMTSRGANLAVDRAATLAAAPALDITNEVMTQLNQQLPSVSVTPLPQQQAQQPQGR